MGALVCGLLAFPYHGVSPAPLHTSGHARLHAADLCLGLSRLCEPVFPRGWVLGCWGLPRAENEAVWMLLALSLCSSLCGYTLVEPGPGRVMSVRGSGLWLCRWPCLCISSVHVGGCFLRGVVRGSVGCEAMSGRVLGPRSSCVPLWFFPAVRGPVFSCASTRVGLWPRAVRSLCGAELWARAAYRWAAEPVSGAGPAGVTTSKGVAVATRRSMSMWGWCPCMCLRSRVCLCPGVPL